MWNNLWTRTFYPYLVIEQRYQIGVRSFPLVSPATAMSTGAVMALQFGFGLERFGGKYYVPKVVALSLVRELGPVFTSLMLAGRIGAGITAEIGSMNVTQQIDAIRALGTSPIKKIVIPRVLACLIVLPLLTVIANFIGIFGSSFHLPELNLGLDAVSFFTKKSFTPSSSRISWWEWPKLYSLRRSLVLLAVITECARPAVPKGSASRRQNP